MGMSSTFTEAQGTDDAVLLLLRKLQRLHPDALADVLRKMPDDSHAALYRAEARADRVRLADERDGITRTYPADEN